MSNINLRPEEDIGKAKLDWPRRLGIAFLLGTFGFLLGSAVEESRHQRELIRAELGEFNRKTGIFELRSKAAIAQDLVVDSVPLASPTPTPKK